MNENAKPTLVSLPIDLVNATLAYLGKRPYEEVAILIASIQKEAIELPGSVPPKRDE